MSDIMGLIRKYSGLFGRDPNLMLRLGMQESSLNPKARSSAGAQGVFQLMPGTAREMGVLDPWDPEQNVRGGIGYYSKLYNRYGNDLDALSAYNSGQPWKRGQKIPQTRDFAERILSGNVGGASPTAGMGLGMLNGYGRTPFTPVSLPESMRLKVPERPQMLPVERAPRPDIPSVPSYGQIQGERANALNNILQALNPMGPQIASQEAARAQMQAEAAAWPALNPEDYRYTPYVPEPLPERREVPLPQYGEARANPWAQLGAAIGGFISPNNAGMLNAVPLQAAIAGRERQYQEDVGRYGLEQRREDVRYQDALAGTEQANRYGLMNWQGEQGLAQQYRNALRADAIEKAHRAGLLAASDLLLGTGGQPGRLQDLNEQAKLMARAETVLQDLHTRGQELQQDFSNRMALFGPQYEAWWRQQNMNQESNIRRGEAYEQFGWKIPLQNVENTIDWNRIANPSSLYGYPLQQQRMGLQELSSVRALLSAAPHLARNPEAVRAMYPGVDIPDAFFAAFEPKAGLMDQRLQSAQESLSMKLSEGELKDPEVKLAADEYARRFSLWADAQKSYNAQLNAGTLMDVGTGRKKVDDIGAEVTKAQVALAKARENYRRRHPQTPGDTAKTGDGAKAGKAGNTPRGFANPRAGNKGNRTVTSGM